MKFSRYVIAFSAAAAVAGLCAPADAAIKCWTNKEGVRECGQSVPPEYAQKEHEELSKQGTVLKETERALTPAEIEAQKKKEAEEAEKKRVAEEQAREDEILLATFSNTDEIERQLTDQLAALNARISTTETFMHKVQDQLDKRMEAAAAEERAGKPPNETLKEDIESLKRQLKNNEQSIEDMHKEQETTKAEYAAKIQRFRELKGETASE